MTERKATAAMARQKCKKCDGYRNNSAFEIRQKQGAQHSPLPHYTLLLFFTLISKSDFPSSFFTGLKIMKQFGVHSKTWLNSHKINKHIRSMQRQRCRIVPKQQWFPNLAL